VSTTLIPGLTLLISFPILFIFHFSMPQGSKKSRHLRRATYPPPRPLSPPVSSAFAPQSGPKSDPLPPPLSGCSCSVCNAKQSLGALTLGKALKQQQTTNQHTRYVCTPAHRVRMYTSTPGTYVHQHTGYVCTPAHRVRMYTSTPRMHMKSTFNGPLSKLKYH